MTAPLPYLDFADPAFSTRGPEIRAARERSWCARTPYGFAILRHAHVGRLLRDRRLRQGSAAWPDKHGLAGPFSQFWRRCVIGCEGETHKALRQIITPVLSEDFVAAMTPTYDAIARDLVTEMARTEACEFQSTFAKPFAGRVIAHLLGMPQEAWPSIAEDAATLGLAMGVECKRHETLFDAAYLRLEDLAERLIRQAREAPDHSRFVDQMTARAAAGGIGDRALLDMIVIAIFGGVDTTRGQLGLGLSLFIDHPAQWRALRADPGLAPLAVDEIIRARPTTTWVSREALEDLELDGVRIDKGATLHLLVHASARDPIAGESDAFDIRRRRKIHFGFGGGAHHCIGHLMARADIAAALRALSRRLPRIAYDPDDAPVWLPDSGNTAPERLPIRYEVAESAG